MLTQIHISNLLTIKHLQLELKSNLTVITGESGVGKSILIGAIELALGARVTTEMVRAEAEKADICLCFDLTSLPLARNWLTQYDLHTASNECMIRRTLHRDGRSRSYINDMPTTLQPLREFSELLMTIHGQHEHQTLLKSDVQRNLLDRYAHHENLALTVEEDAKKWHALQKEIRTLQKEAETRAARMDYLTFQLAEWEALQLTPTELSAMDLQHKQLAHAEELLVGLGDALQTLSENEQHHAMHYVNHTIRTLESIQRVDPRITQWIDQLSTIQVQLSDIETELHRYHASIEADPAELKRLEERMGIIFNLARKHKIDPNELSEFYQKLQTELNSLQKSDERIESLQADLKAIEKNYSKNADLLSQKRQQSAKKLEKQITQIMQTLAIPNGRFAIQLESLPKEDFPLNGLEKIHFHIQTNPDHPLLPLNKIASGGELSRISLAILVATAEQQTIPTLIFDEIDVGVSGHTAETIGQLLRQLGDTFQVFCITHVPQVAALGHHHLRVEKSIQDKTTYTHIKPLSLSEKTAEIARMLGGKEKTAKAHAKEMMSH